MTAGTLTYNLEDSLDAVAALIEANEAEQFTDFIDECFSVKFTDDCENIIIADNTDYEEVDTDNLTYTITITIKRAYAMDTVIIGNAPFVPGSKVMYGKADGFAGDGEYCVTINGTYIADDVTYTNESEICKTLNCCGDEICSLKNNIKCKMGAVGCKIKDNLRMGKKVFALQNMLFKLTLMLNLLDECGNGCEDYESVLCEFNGMKNINC